MLDFTLDTEHWLFIFLFQGTAENIYKVCFCSFPKNKPNVQKINKVFDTISSKDLGPFIDSTAFKPHFL